MSRGRTGFWFAVVGVGIVVLAGGAAGVLSSRGATSIVASDTVMIQRGTIVLDVRERGLVRPARVVPIQSRISSNQPRVLWLHDEGVWVNKGLVVARFDSKPFQDVLDRTEQELADAHARLAVAQKALEVQREETAVRVERVQRDLEIARIRAEDLRHGTGHLERQRLLQAVEQAARQERLARQELEDFEMLLTRGFVSQRERDTVADRLLVAEERLLINRQQLENHDRFERPRKLREAEVIVETALAELERVENTAAVEVRGREEEIVRQRRAVAQAQRAVERARQDVAQCDVHAPVDGPLLYRELPRSDGRRKIQIGDEVWQGQTFMEIPDTSALAVEASVREVDVTKLAGGMPAEVRLDALSGQVFPGFVESVNPVAEADPSNPHLRRFRVRVRLETVEPGVQVGMSAEVRIVHRRVEDVLVAPLNALTYRAEGPMMRVMRNQAAHWAPVQIGAIGDDLVEIVGGIAEGAVVALGDW